MGRSVARTAGFNVATTLTAGVGGIIVARAVGPSVRGEYAAIMAWFGVAVMVCCMGQPEALVYFVASDPSRANEYVATARAMMMSTGALALGAGLIIAPMIARGSSVVTVGLRIAFAASVVTFLAGSYTASLQGRDLRKWNAARLSQPLFSLLGMVVLWKLRLLNLESAIWVVGAAVLLQLGWAYHSCQKVALVPGRARIELVRPLSGYGVAQIAAQAPAMLNNYLDQIILSQTVPSADLGRYAIAVSLSMLPFPIVSAIGNVAFRDLLHNGR